MRWLVAMIAAPLLAHDPATTRLTYTRDISRLINRRCIACHGANAAVPLASYEQSRPWAKAIRDQVMTRQMPPWGAVAGFGPDLQGDPSLTASEIATVVRWVEGGAPEGNAALLPTSKPSAALPVPSLTHSPLMRLGCEWRAPRNFLLVGLRSRSALRMTLTLPDGAVLPVIWLRELPTKPPDFVFVAPLRIPRGSTLRVASDEELDAALALSPVGASPLLPGTENRKQTPRCPVP